MKCTDVRENLESFLDEELGVKLRNEISEHLKDCEDCEGKFIKLSSVTNLIRKELPVSPAKQIDAKVLAAFRQHHQKKSGWSWLNVFPSLLSFKTAVAVLIVGLLTGFAFLIGRITAPNTEVSVAAPQVIEKEVPREVVKYVEVPVTKYVEVPVEKEKVITRIAYREIEAQPKSISQSTQAKNTSTNQENLAQKMDLADFQPLSEISPKVLKKGEMDEK